MRERRAVTLRSVGSDASGDSKSVTCFDSDKSWAHSPRGICRSRALPQHGNPASSTDALAR